MLIDIILLSLAFIALAAGTITDIKTREVPDWISYGLIFAGIGIRLIYSVITSDLTYLGNGVIGLAVFVALGYFMFYAGQWGGGDSKLLMGLGAALGLPLSFTPLPLMIIFLVNVLCIGAAYGLVYSIVLAVIHRKKFAADFKKLIYNKKIMKIRKLSLLLTLVVVLLIVILVKDAIVIWALITLVAIAYLSFYLVIFVKAVEKSTMFKLVKPEQLTEGDWIAKDYYHNKKRICGPKDLGIEKYQIKQLIALKKKIMIKEGIPFVPSFLAAFIASLIFGAWFLVFL